MPSSPAVGDSARGEGGGGVVRARASRGVYGRAWSGEHAAPQAQAQVHLQF